MSSHSFPIHQWKWPQISPMVYQLTYLPSLTQWCNDAAIFPGQLPHTGTVVTLAVLPSARSFFSTSPFLSLPTLDPAPLCNCSLKVWMSKKQWSKYFFTALSQVWKSYCLFGGANTVLFLWFSCVKTLCRWCLIYVPSALLLWHLSQLSC